MFSVVCVCLSVHKGEGGSHHVTITYNALDLTIQGPPGLRPVPDMETSLNRHSWSPMGMFKLFQLEPHYTETPPPPEHVHETLKVGKRAADVLLECFLVVKMR